MADSAKQPLTGLAFTLANEGTTRGGAPTYMDTTGNETGWYGVKVTPDLRKALAVHKGPVGDFWLGHARRIYNQLQVPVNKGLAALGVKGATPQEMTYFNDMGYQLGPNFLSKFPKFSSALSAFWKQPTQEGLDATIAELRNSKWYKYQTPKRARLVADGLYKELGKHIPPAAQLAFNNYMRSPAQ